jgi:oligo-1,6-glucosidase
MSKTRAVTARDWWKSAVVYQVYPRSFADSDGDGVGDLGGVIEHLDHLQRLGVDVVWLSPVYKSPMADNGYDISDYEAVDPLFGSLEQLDELIGGLHQRGMKLVMDLVVNHTSSAHAWFKESRSSRDNPRRSWYWWRPPREGFEPGTPGAEPTNWGSAFSGPAWTYDAPTGEYYLHLFAPEQPDLNWENPEVRQAVYAMMNRWLDRGVDGFRMDVVCLLSKLLEPDPHGGPPRLPDGHIGVRDPLGAGVVDTTQYGDTTPYVVNGPRIHEFMQEMHREVFAGRPPGLLNVGETPATTIEQARLYTDPARAEVDMVFQFEHVDLDSGPSGKWDIAPMTMLDLKHSLHRWQRGLAETGWNSLYLGNHDQPRCVSRFGNDAPEHREQSAKSLATVLHLHRGTPYVYQGDELGLPNAGFTRLDQLRDIESLNYHATAVAAGRTPDEVMTALSAKGRDNARVPMPWDDSPTGGFTTGTPWIEVHPLVKEVNAAAQVDDPDSVFAHFQRLIALRHDEPVVAHGTFRMLLPDDEQVYAFVREHEADRLLVVANLSDVPDVVADVDEPYEHADLLLGSVPGSTPSPSDPLAAWESRVYRLR